MTTQENKLAQDLHEHGTRALADDEKRQLTSDVLLDRLIATRRRLTSAGLGAHDFVRLCELEWRLMERLEEAKRDRDGEPVTDAVMDEVRAQLRARGFDFDMPSTRVIETLAERHPDPHVKRALAGAFA